MMEEEWHNCTNCIHRLKKGDEMPCADCAYNTYSEFSYWEGDES